MFKNDDYFVLERIRALFPRWPESGLSSAEVMARAKIGSTLHGVAGTCDTGVREPGGLVDILIRGLVGSAELEPLPGRSDRFRVVARDALPVAMPKTGRSRMVRGTRP